MNATTAYGYFKVNTLTERERASMLSVIEHAKSGTWPANARFTISSVLARMIARASDARDHGMHRDLRAAADRLTR